MKPDKYNIFDRECPYKEEWKSENDKIHYEEVRKSRSKKQKSRDKKT